jgi:NAD(P)-dependent dehydrogenase (short-subunit alcohol dehydrogenase family)
MSRMHHGRVAVISGAASGIGQASAVRLANDGAKVVVVDRANAQQTLDLITASGGAATAIVCDVSNPESVAALKTEVESKIGRATSSSTTPVSFRPSDLKILPLKIGGTFSP